tara:strand:- start:401 stop:2122 length:1722 start_codon:yes stop_codon:yes gene_type:complete
MLLCVSMLVLARSSAAVLLKSGRAGFCAVTSVGEGVHCSPQDHQGSWGKPDLTLQSCIARCAACQRCHFVSYSRKEMDCSWFRHCGSTLLQGATAHTTFHVRSSSGTLLHKNLAAYEFDRAGQSSVHDIVQQEGLIVTRNTALACLGTSCMSWRGAQREILQHGGQWHAALPQHKLQHERKRCPGGSYQFEEAEARARKTCVDARRQALRRKGGRFDPRNVLTSLSSATPELLDALSYKARFKSRQDWVPSLTQSLYANTALKGGSGNLSGLLRPLACAQARYEDVAILLSFFTDSDGAPIPVQGATFLEMGGFDGLTESTTWLFEQCFGWRGILIEASPREFDLLRQNRPTALNLRLAGCRTEGTILMASNYYSPSNNRAAESVASLAGVQHLMNTTCGPIGKRLAGLGVRVTGPCRWRHPSPSASGAAATLSSCHGCRACAQQTYATPRQIALAVINVRSLPWLTRHRVCTAFAPRLGVHRVDFFSLDVEGAETTILSTLGLGSHLAVGVLMVEVRDDGQRGTIMRLLLERGLVYVGALHGRPSPANEVVSDVYANMTHLRAHFPRSRALV